MRFRRTGLQTAVLHRSKVLDKRKLRRAASVGDAITSQQSMMSIKHKLYKGHICFV